MCVFTLITSTYCSERSCLNVMRRPIEAKRWLGRGDKIINSFEKKNTFFLITLYVISFAMPITSHVSGRQHNTDPGQRWGKIITNPTIVQPTIKPSVPVDALVELKHCSFTGYSLIIVFFLKVLWLFWTLPVLLHRWFSTCLVFVHTMTPRDNRVRNIFKNSEKHNI